MRAPVVADDDIVRLIGLLRALADPNRLRLLCQLAEPHALDDLHLAPASSFRRADPERTLTDEGVRYHLRILRDAGLVHVRVRRRADGRHVDEFQADPGALASLAGMVLRLGSPEASAANPPSA